MSHLTRQCPFHNCDRLISAGLFACGQHWYSLNKQEQKEIYACYGEWRQGTIDGDELRRRQQAVLGERGTA